MSKAEVYAAMAKDMKFSEEGKEEVSACVTEDGNLVMSSYADDEEAMWFSPKEALRLARWINATFGEPE